MGPIFLQAPVPIPDATSVLVWGPMALGLFFIGRLGWKFFDVWLAGYKRRQETNLEQQHELISCLREIRTAIAEVGNDLITIRTEIPRMSRNIERIRERIQGDQINDTWEYEPEE